MKKDQIVPVRFSYQEKEFLKQESKKIGVGLSTLVRMVMRDYIKEKKGRQDV